MRFLLYFLILFSVKANSIDTNEIFKSAALGDMQAQYELAMINSDSEDIVSLSQSLIWLQLAANQGHVDSSLALGRLYYNHDTFLFDIDKSIFWFRKASESGNILAQLKMAEFYLNGDGVPINLNKAIQFLIKAAEQGNIQSHVKLGEIYHNKIDDLNEAIKW